MTTDSFLLLLSAETGRNASALTPTNECKQYKCLSSFLKLGSGSLIRFCRGSFEIIITEGKKIELNEYV